MLKTGLFSKCAFVLFIAVSSAAVYEITVETAPQRDEIADIKINAKGVGNPHVNFDDGKTISLPEGVAGGAPLKTIGSGDVDSDGVPDLIAVDAGGGIIVFKGNIDTIFPNSPEAQRRRAENTHTDEPFIYSHRSSAFPIAPDEIAVGDVSADGLLDIVAIKYGDSRVYIAAGGGNGHFSQPVAYPLGGSITAFTSGEIGRADGQLDLAVAFSNKGGHLVAVFETPGGAFEKAPELIRLASPAMSLAVGHLDTDFYGDIAAASGNKLTVIRGRGHVSPWDRLEGYDIRRPEPIVQTRTMPFDIASLAVGDLTENRGQDLAMLSRTGVIYTLDDPVDTREDTKQVSPEFVGKNEAAPSRGIGQQFAKYNLFKERAVAGDGDDPVAELRRFENGLMKPLTQTSSAQDGRENVEKTEFAGISGTLAQQDKRRTVENFLRAVSPKRAANLSRWELKEIVRDGRLANASGGWSPKIIRVRVSDSGRDEIALIDQGTNKIHVATQEDPRNKRSVSNDTFVSFELSSAPTAILPMRLNEDALTDLVVLIEGAISPYVLATAPTATYVVTTADDEDNGFCGETCSLRDAIEEANLNPGVHTIRFNIPGGPALIQPQTALPTITKAVTIDGTTQPGYAGSPVIEIRGDQTGDGENGLNINAANCTIRGLAINSFRFAQDDPEEPGVGGYGISIFNFIGQTTAQFNIIEANYLGTDRTGSLDRGNEMAGLYIYDSDFNIVGGSASFQRNVMSGNGNGEVVGGNRFGAGLSIVAANNNLVIGNYVGLAANGSSALPNSVGIRVLGKNNTIGSDGVGTGNVVSGNRHLFAPTTTSQGWCGGVGILDESLIDPKTSEWLTELNNYRGNRVGTNASGTSAVSNCSTGLKTSPRNSSFIGSVTSSGRNIVSGNRNGGIVCSPFMPFEFYPYNLVPTLNTDGATVPEGFCRITGNNAGTDITGNTAIPNNHDSIVLANTNGVFLFSPAGGIGILNTNTLSDIGAVNGTSASGCTGFCNLSSGNRAANPSALLDDGIAGIVRRGGGDVSIYKNYVGTNVNGTAALGNQNGIQFEGMTYVGNVLDPNTTPISLGNLVSGNTSTASGAGVGIRGDSGFLNVIQGNLIGTDRNGASAIPNSSGMILGSATGATIIGGEHPVAGNVISGNAGAGIDMTLGPSAATRNNRIGVGVNGEPLGNSGDGIIIRSNFEYIGAEGAGNIIANNGGNGILILIGTTLSVGNQIRFNSIYNNGGLGIDLSADNTPPREGDGVTPNDCEDPDTGPNMLQNYPVLTAPVFNGDGTVTVGGAFDSTPSTTFTVDFYSNTTADPSNYGEGETHIGSTSVTTGPNGRTSVLFNSTVPVAPGRKITATATDPNGNTSEFSCFAGECSLTGGLTEGSEIDQILGSGCQIGFVVNINTDESDPNPADGICDVDLSTPDEQCSLRAAIETTNAVAGTDFINFAIPGAGPHTITLNSELPIVAETVIIAASTQPGFSGTPLIEITGGGTIATGLQFAPGGSGSSVSSISFTRITSAIVSVANDIRVSHSYFGIAPDGSGAGTTTEQEFGVAIRGSNSEIGPGNYFGNHAYAVGIEDGANNKIFGNRLGIGPNSTTAIPNLIGILLRNSDSNEIGDGTAQGANIIAGNLGAALDIQNGSELNEVAGNFIGVSFDNGGQPVTYNRKTGILLRAAATKNKIRANTIGGHKQDDSSAGVLIDATAADENEVLSNFVGMTPDTFLDIGNRNGVVVFADKQKVVGNRVGYTSEAGILVAVPPDSPNTEVTQNEIELNQIGVSIQGDAYPNEKFGVLLNGQATSNLIKRNVIGNNGLFGIIAANGADLNTFEENVVGFIFNGIDHVNPGGIWLRNVSNNIVTKNAVTKNPIGILLGTNIGFGNTTPPDATGYFTTKRDGTPTQSSGNRLSGNVVRDSSVGIAVGDNTVGNFVGPDDGDFNVVLGSSGSELGVGILVGTLDAGASPSVLARQNTIQRNVIGFDPQTQTANGNVIGMMITGAVENLIGGATDANANYIVASTQDGLIATDRADDNTLRINKVGVAPNGLPIGNGGNGIVVEDGATNTVIESGSEKPGVMKDGSSVPSGTVIVGSGLNGIVIRTGAIGTKIRSVLVEGNQGNGIVVESSDGTVIGPSSKLQSVRVTGNTVNGIFVKTGALATKILKTLVENNESAGIAVENAQQTEIGSDKGIDDGNIISENQEAGIRLVNSVGGLLNSNTVIRNGGPGVHAYRSSFFTIQQNAIGIIRDADVPDSGNQGAGILLEESPGNTVGGTVNSMFNQIGKNLQSAIHILNTHQNSNPLVETGSVGPTVIEGNLLGGRTSSFGGIANRASNAIGIHIQNSSRVRIGGLSSTSGNSVVANNGFGVRLSGGLTSLVSIANNAIGAIADHHGTATEPMGNGSDGVHVEDGAGNNSIGGEEQPRGLREGNSSAPNIIATNGGSGITLAMNAGDGNRFLGNSIFGNAVRGINIGSGGLIPNDPGDPDEGPNRLQNYPQILSRQIVGGELIVSFVVDTAPANANYGTSGLEVAFYKADGSGQGEKYLGSGFYTAADYKGGLMAVKTVNLGSMVLLGIKPNDPITATATDADGNTSEFTPPLGPTSAGVTISGRVLTTAGVAIRGTTVTITDENGVVRSAVTSSLGYYEFEGVQAGRTYVVTAVSRRYRFTPRIVNIADPISDLDLMALE
ncbi:MAG: right-handed parallel beta-helix repeat-containing protein [Acidobacteria bacterium]|nr:right-handed parallel beta-helix repeat-containing protein [Acidobacteriota bacterium]